MATNSLERRHVRLHKVGGSRSVVVPKEWLESQNIEDEVDIVLTPDAILIERSAETALTIENEPEFASFMSFLLADTLKHPATLVDPTKLLARADALLRDVDPD
jgi:hypothetical protein